MTTISFENLTAQELDDFNEFISSAKSYHLLRKMEWITNKNSTDDERNQMIAYHEHYYDSFNGIVSKMKVNHDAC